MRTIQEVLDELETQENIEEYLRARVPFVREGLLIKSCPVARYLSQETGNEMCVSLSDCYIQYHFLDDESTNLPPKVKDFVERAPSLMVAAHEDCEIQA